MQTHILSFQNSRDHMEDYHYLNTNFLDKSYIFAGVYDGHGGSSVPEYASKNLHKLFEKHLMDSEPSQAFINTYEQISQNTQEEKGGTCAITCFIKDGVVYHANVGDGKMIVVSDSIKELTVEHTVTNETEKERVLTSGGTILGPYVFMEYRGLKVTRSLGDSFHRQFGVISTPYTGEYVIKPKDKYLILGSDGLFDYISDERIMEICSGTEDAILKELKKEVLKNKSGDNVTVVLVGF